MRRSVQRFVPGPGTLISRGRGRVSTREDTTAVYTCWRPGATKQSPRLERVSVRYTFFLLCDSGVAASGDWVGGLQWIALLYRHSSRKCAAPRRLSPKPKKESHRPRLNLRRARVSNPLSRPGHLLQSVATRDGWPPAERLPAAWVFQKAAKL